MRWIDTLSLHFMIAWLYLRLWHRAPRERLEAIVHGGLCPHCRAKFRISEKGLLLPGPKGGLTQNVYCPDCGNGWNYTPSLPPGALPVQDIGPVSPELIARYQNLLLWTDE